MYIYKRPSLGTNKVKQQRKLHNMGLGFRCPTYSGSVVTKQGKTLWWGVDYDLRKLKRRMRRAGWIR